LTFDEVLGAARDQHQLLAGANRLKAGPLMPAPEGSLAIPSRQNPGIGGLGDWCIGSESALVSSSNLIQQTRGHAALGW
jgi:hypothetical protein